MSKTAMALAMLLILPLSVGLAGCGGAGETAATPTAAPAPAPTAQPVTLKLATSSKPNGVAAEAYHYFAEMLEEYTDGQVAVDVYPGSQLLRATEQWEAVVTGAIDIYADATYWFYQYVPDVMVSYIDGLWEGYDHAYAALEDSELPRVLAERIEEAGPVKVLGFLPAGMVMGIINSVRETKYLKDLEGLRVNSAPDAPPAPIEDYSGMVGVPIALESAGAAFLQGVLDAAHYPADVIANLGMYERGNHVLYRTTMFPMLALVMNRDAWQRLTPDAQDIILNRVMPEVYEFDKMRYREVEDEAMKRIAENVETVNWCTQEDLDTYIEFASAHPVIKVQMLMVDPRIPEIIEAIRPSAQ